MAATNLPPGPTNLAIYEPDMPAINPAINNPSIPNPSAFRKPAPLPMGMSPDRNLANLFNTLNTISANAINQMSGERDGGGTGGGSEPTEGNMDANPLIALNPYISKNVSSFEHGGTLKSSLQKIAGELSKASQMHKKQSEKIGSMSEKFNMGGEMDMRQFSLQEQTQFKNKLINKMQIFLLGFPLHTVTKKSLLKQTGV